MLHDYTENQQRETDQSMFVHAFSPLSLLAVFFFFRSVLGASPSNLCSHETKQKKIEIFKTQMHNKTRWWFQIFCIFTPTRGRFPI